MTLIFSYGTLQREDVQLAQVGRAMAGLADALPGFRTVPVPIDDPSIVESLGISTYDSLEKTGRPEDEVAGTVFEVTDAELERIDAYEAPEYGRFEVVLKSGRRGWAWKAVNPRTDQ